MYLWAVIQHDKRRRRRRRCDTVYILERVESEIKIYLYIIIKCIVITAAIRTPPSSYDIINVVQNTKSRGGY